MKKLTGLAVALALIAAACGGGDNGDSANPNGSAVDSGDDAGDTGDPVATGGESAQLCGLATQIEADELTSGLSILDGEAFFDATAELWSSVAAVAPAEVQPEVAAIRDNLNEFQSILAEYDYDYLDPNLQVALDDLNIAELAIAGRGFDEYVSQACGIEFDSGDVSGSVAAPGVAGLDGDDLEQLQEDLGTADLDEDAAIELLAQSLNIDADLARCLTEELGALDTDNVDPSLLNEDVCGTTLLEVITGIAG